MEWLSGWVLPWLLPPGLNVAGGLLALGLWAGGARRTAFACAGLAIASLWLFGAPAFAFWLATPLEAAHPALLAEAVPRAEAIVVLGGGASPPLTRALEPDLGHGADRVWMAARLYRAGRAPLVIASGGRTPGLREADGSEAQAMAHYLRAWGVVDEAIVTENESLNTWENCHYAAELAGSRTRVLLVTSALHMPRAMLACREAGLQPVAVPTDFRTLGHPPDRPWIPDTAALSLSRDAIKERLATLVLVHLLSE